MDDNVQHSRRATDRIVEDTAVEVRQVDIRLNRLEAQTENLHSALSGLGSDVKALSQVVRDSNKTNWNVLATWAGVIIMLVIALGNGYVGAPLRQITDDLAELTKSFNAHTSDGHPRYVVEQIKEVQRDIETNKKTRDRERELLMMYLEEKFSNQRTDIDDLHKWQYDVNQAHQERLLDERALERLIQQPKK